MTAQEKIIWWRVALVVTLAFVITLVVVLKLFPLLPDYDGLSQAVTLGLPLALAWFVAAVVGRNIVPAPHALALATVCLLVATPAAYVLRGQPSHDTVTPGGDNAQAGEVLFKYEASFTYLSSEENVTLMGYYVLFPCPTVDGEPALTADNLRWQLWGPVEGENGARWMELEVDNNYIFQRVGLRENIPFENRPGFGYGWPGSPFHLPNNSFITTFGLHGFTWKIVLQNDSDNLYPGEILKSIGSFSVPAEKADKVTLEEDNEIVRQENGKVLAAKSLYILDENGEPVEITLDLSFRVKLSKQIENNFVVVKEYSRELENTGSWMRRRLLELYPTS